MSSTTRKILVQQSLYVRHHLQKVLLDNRGRVEKLLSLSATKKVFLNCSCKRPVIQILWKTLLKFLELISIPRELFGLLGFDF